MYNIYVIQKMIKIMNSVFPVIIESFNDIVNKYFKNYRTPERHTTIQI